MIPQDKKKKHHHVWLFIYLIFFGVLFFLIYTSFFNPDLARGLTGRVVGFDKEEVVNGVSMDAELGLGVIDVGSYMDKLSFRLDQDASFLVGEGNIKLSKRDSVVIDGFNGKFLVDGMKISNFEGSADRIFIDGLPIEGIDGGIELWSEGFSYSFLEMEGVYLDSLSYPTSGRININDDKVVVRLNEEGFELNKFKGNVDISRGLVRMDGLVDRSNVKGLVEGDFEERE